MAIDELEEQEMFFDCPYCGEPISMLIDPSAEEQEYIEDCEVCCRPIQITYNVEQGKIAHFSAQGAGG